MLSNIHTRLKENHYIYEVGNRVLILSKIGDGSQQLFLYKTDTGEVVYGQGLKKYYVKPGRLSFNGKNIKYRLHSKHTYMVATCESVAPYFTAIPGKYNEYDSTYDLPYNYALNKSYYDMYEYDLGMFSFVPLAGP